MIFVIEKHVTNKRKKKKRNGVYKMIHQNIIQLLITGIPLMTVNVTHLNRRPTNDSAVKPRIIRWGVFHSCYLV